MKTSLVALLAFVSGAAAGNTQLVVGQNYANEWQAFQTSIKTPAGISLYGDIYDGMLNTDSIDILESYSGR